MRSDVTSSLIWKDKTRKNLTLDTRPTTMLHDPDLSILLPAAKMVADLEE